MPERPCVTAAPCQCGDPTVPGVHYRVGDPVKGCYATTTRRLPDATAATEGAPMDDNAAYDAAKHDPVAALILDALHKQDANTYHGNSGTDIGRRALDTAAAIREVVGKEERQRLAALFDEHRDTLTEFVDNPNKMLGLVILLLGLDKP